MKHPTTLIEYLIDLQNTYTRQCTALGRAIDLLKAAEAGDPERADGRPKRTFSAAAKRRMSRGMKQYWRRRKATARQKAVILKSKAGKGK